ncbi:hypothetical protein [Alkalicoccus urumqiensis]|uniref:Uncharacterized protein n=1 Tax=Alkalicoccus urumqiensis TaxID=1548213 RepID=A0A2P6MK34_ALKUR|nr:hypothetical protein [Alkalicoccus urumqiensis]PRO66644.1 hypothetical protein C6I21_04695 [Alkalicoccus urumqiensis]
MEVAESSCTVCSGKVALFRDNGRFSSGSRRSTAAAPGIEPQPVLAEGQQRCRWMTKWDWAGA